MTKEELKAIRLSKGMNQKEFAALLHTSDANVSRWENGKHDVPDWVEKEIFRIVNVSLPIEDLYRLIEHTRTTQVPLDQLIGNAIRAYLSAPASSQNVIPLYERKEDKGTKVAEDKKDE